MRNAWSLYGFWYPDHTPGQSNQNLRRDLAPVFVLFCLSSQAVPVAAKLGTPGLNETPQVSGLLGAQWAWASSLTHFLLLPPPPLNSHRIALHLSWPHHTQERWLPQSWRILLIFMLKQTGLSSHFYVPSHHLFHTFIFLPILPRACGFRTFFNFCDPRDWI